MITMMIISNTLVILYDPLLIIESTYEQFYTEFSLTLSTESIKTIHVFINIPEADTVRPTYCYPYSDAQHFIDDIEYYVNAYLKTVDRQMSVIYHFPTFSDETFRELYATYRNSREDISKRKYFFEDSVVFKMAKKSYIIIGFMRTMFGKRIIIQKSDEPELQFIAKTSIVVPYYGVFMGDLDMVDEIGDQVNEMYCYYLPR